MAPRSGATKGSSMDYICVPTVLVMAMAIVAGAIFLVTAIMGMLP